MTTEPLEEAEATSRPVYDLPETSLDNEADDNSAETPGESQSPDPLSDDVPPVVIDAALAEQQDAEEATGQDDDQVSEQNGTSMGQGSEQINTLITQVDEQAFLEFATSTGQDEQQASVQMATSIGQNESPDAPSHDQETLENSSLLPQDPGLLQAFVGFQNPVWDRLAENNRTSRSRTVSPSNSQNQEKIPGNLSVPEGQPEIDPKTDARSVLPEKVQPSVGATDPSTSDTSGPDPEPTGIIKSTEQGAAGFKALDPESKARSPVPTSEDLTDDSRIPQVLPFPCSSIGSTPPSPDPYQVALRRNHLDTSLYRPDVENDYMRSMTSLLGGGEGSISSLADILVWSDTATGMGLAVGFLTTGRSSPADRLQDEGPRLRTVSSLLGSARSAFSSGLVSGTSTALRSVSHLLESVERRTVEGIRSAMRYLANHFTSRWARTGSSSD